MNTDQAETNTLDVNFVNLRINETFYPILLLNRRTLLTLSAITLFFSSYLSVGMDYILSFSF